MNRLKTIGLLLLTAVAASGCEQGEQQWTVSGRLDQATFPVPITVVVLTQGGVTVSEAQPSEDGSFALAVWAGAGLRIDLITDDTTLPLVIPRTTSDGSSDYALDVSFGLLAEERRIDLDAWIEDALAELRNDHPSRSFSLGTLRYLADPFGTQYISMEDEGVSCVDGVDAVTGARCIDPGPSGTLDCLEDVTDTAYTEAVPLDMGVTEGVLADRSIPLALCISDEGDRHDGDGDEQDGGACHKEGTHP